MFYPRPFYPPFMPCPCHPIPQQICCTTIFFPTYQQPVYQPVQPTYVKPATSNQPNMPNMPNVPNVPNQATMYGRKF